MRFRFSALATPGLLLTVLVSVSAASPEPRAGEGELAVSETARSVKGQFAFEDSTVVFDAVRSAEGRVKVSVMANGQPFDFTFDPGASKLHVDGHNGQIFGEGRKALKALSESLEKRWDPYDSLISLEQHLAFRAILFLSEMPAGHVMEERILDVPAFPPNVQLPPDMEDDRQEDSGGESSSSDTLQGQVSSTGCEVADDDGISAIPCGPSSGVAWHDACFLHGFSALSEVLGCSFQTDCLGRCGSGCGFAGAGVYTQDCADHDSCCRVHGGCTDPGDDLCGDEFGEAADDFLLGAAKCSGCKPSLPPPPDPDPCGAEFELTETYALGGGGGARRTRTQMSYELSRVEQRFDGRFMFGEWALLKAEDRGVSLLDASSENFGEATRRHFGKGRPPAVADDGDGRLLVVEAGVHPRNNRWMPTPSVAAIEASVPTNLQPEGMEFRFRLEVSEGGAIGRFAVLGEQSSLGAEVVEVISRELKVRYRDQRRHRLVIFGRAELIPGGRLEASEFLVTMPMCCCGPDEPHCV